MITLWGRLNSLNVQKVVWCLEEIGAPYERIEAGQQHGVVGTPAYREMNPNGLVPTIRDGDLALWESNAIVRYLCAKYADRGFWPADPARRALSDRWMDWQQGTLWPAVGPAFMGLVRTPPDKRDHGAIKASCAAAETNLAILDAALATSPWLGGERLGIGDFAVGPAIHRWLNMPVERTPRPHVERWYAAFIQRPAAARVLTLPLS